MKYSDLIKSEIEATYAATEGLIKLVDTSNLNWRPTTGKNWMTVGQLLKHIPTACGFCIRGFVTGQWGMPDGADGSDMLPSAEKMPSVKNVEEALKELAADKKLALETLAKVSEKDLESKMIAAPWGGPPMPLGVHCHQMVGHLANHKAQLFYYLKLLGKDVNTMHLYGMGS
ncbi:MAG: hypothetical protein HPKKFMNG_00794 [Planctomycetes bacterium]|nr:hypothetical protein [Planctomycetota bacterium]HRJ77805.1 DinB family protein [Planctomycetota bacterium]